MFLGDSIGRALEELWQLAMTMASLKHIAEMVNQELQTNTASTGRECLLWNLLICLFGQDLKRIIKRQLIPTEPLKLTRQKQSAISALLTMKSLQN